MVEEEAIMASGSEVFLKSDGLHRETLQTTEVRDKRIGLFRRFAVPFRLVPSDITLKKNGAAASIDRQAGHVCFYVSNIIAFTHTQVELLCSTHFSELKVSLGYSIRILFTLVLPF